MNSPGDIGRAIYKLRARVTQVDGVRIDLRTIPAFGLVMDDGSTGDESDIMAT